MGREQPSPPHEGEQPQQGPLEQFNELMGAVDEYKHQSSLGGVMARVFIRSVREASLSSPATEAPDEVGDKTREHTVREGDRQKMASSVLGITQASTLEALGLSLEPISGKRGMFVSSKEGTTELGEMRLNVVDREKFTAFLATLSPKQIAEGKTSAHLAEFMKILEKQVGDQYDWDNPPDEALELVGGLEHIVGEYERLGLGEQRAVVGLKAGLHHAHEGTLREYLLVSNKTLFKEPGEGFGPADWQRDTTEEQLTKKWHEALEVLEAVKQNQKASELYAQLRDHLRKCVDSAVEDLKELPEKEYSRGRKESLGKVLERAQLELMLAD